jgi:hypothetical protein
MKKKIIECVITILVAAASGMAALFVYMQIFSSKPEEFKTVKMDGCEYLELRAYGFFAHKGNCTNQIHAR